ncbi:exodeoxyribonuclease VII small subunit [Kiritimatiellota bacterium B12222]|nr:exodeoxyribonuclease VII small subunit [Kiritimatiellota bacterium B12222]
MSSPSEKKDEIPFEEAMKRLEVLVQQMEGGELSLDQMITHFEEGSALVEKCGQRLNEVERRIEKLVKKDGEIRSEPFDPEPTP